MLCQLILGAPKLMRFKGQSDDAIFPGNSNLMECLSVGCASSTVQCMFMHDLSLTKG